VLRNWKPVLHGSGILKGKFRAFQWCPGRSMHTPHNGPCPSLCAPPFTLCLCFPQPFVSVLPPVMLVFVMILPTARLQSSQTPAFPEEGQETCGHPPTLFVWCLRCACLSPHMLPRKVKVRVEIRFQLLSPPLIFLVTSFQPVRQLPCTYLCPPPPPKKNGM
jgi:hypothetical protein